MTKNKLAMLWNIIFGKADPLRSGCRQEGKKYYSATIGEITRADYEEWSHAMDVIRAQRKQFIAGKVLYRSGELAAYGRALIVERLHKPNNLQE